MSPIKIYGNKKSSLKYDYYRGITTCFCGDVTYSNFCGAVKYSNFGGGVKYSNFGGGVKYSNCGGGVKYSKFWRRFKIHQY